MSRKRHAKSAVATGSEKRQAKRVLQGGRSSSLRTLFVAGLLSFLALGLYYLSGAGDTQQKRRARPVSKLLQPIDSEIYSAPARSTKETEEFEAWETRNVRGTDDLARARRAESLGWQPERLQSRYNVKVLLNEDSRLAYFEDFVTPEECEHLIVVAKRALNGTINNRHRVKYHQPFRAYNYTYVGGDEDAVVGRLEARIADVTGIPLHPRESRFMLTEYGSLPPQHSHFRVNNVHLDPDMKADRVATVILYLTDVEEGGETVFPTFPTAQNYAIKTAEKEKKPLGEVFHQLTRKIVRKGSTTLRVQAGDRKAPGSLEEAAWASTDQLCRDQTLSVDVPQTSYQQRGKGTFAIKPKRGSAVVFYSRKLDGDLDTQMWHAGCTVVQGTKWIAQKFKGFTS